MVFCCAWAAAMTWSHATGFVMSRPAFWATLLRYHSSWVLAQNGTATSLPFHLAPSTAALTVSSVKPASRFAGTGARKPASANSATNTGSMLIRSMPESLAASRRSSCWRWSLALLGSSWTLMVYLPPEASVHSLAIWAWPFLVGSAPPPSGLMYKFRVLAGPVSLLEQAAREPVARVEIRATPTTAARVLCVGTTAPFKVQPSCAQVYTLGCGARHNNTGLTLGKSAGQDCLGGCGVEDSVFRRSDGARFRIRRPASPGSRPHEIPAVDRRGRAGGQRPRWAGFPRGGAPGAPVADRDGDA